MLARRIVSSIAWLAACAVALVSMTPPRASAADANERAVESTVSAPCKAARQHAWFQRQLRMTDGDSATLPPGDPAACAPVAIAGQQPMEGPSRGEREEDARTKRR
jgi:hypothetical protein